MLPAEIAPHWGFSPQTPPAKSRPKRRSKRLVVKPKPRRLARARAILRLAADRGPVRSRDVAALLGIGSAHASAAIRALVQAGLMRVVGEDWVAHANGVGARVVAVYRITRDGRRWLAGQEATGGG